MIAEELDKFNTKNIFIMNPIKNTMINHGLFYKLLYSNSLFTTNGIYIKIKLNDAKLFNGRLYYDIVSNSNTLNKIVDIEKSILSMVYSKDNNKAEKNISRLKKIYYKIYDQINTGNIKTNNYTIDAVVLKISGIWENDNSLGISYKIMTINKIIEL